MTNYSLCGKQYSYSFWGEEREDIKRRKTLVPLEKYSFLKL